MLDIKAINDGIKNNLPHKLIKRMWYYKTYFKKPYEVINEKPSHEFEIYTIAFNNDKVIDYQIRLVKKNMKDNHLHIIVDNSSDENFAKKIQKICENSNTMYIRLAKNTLFSSQSHALALNYVYKNIISKRDCRYFGFLDHDIFPIKNTSILENVKKQKMYGYLLDKEKLEYANKARTIWPGFCFFDKTLSTKFDFRPMKSIFPLYALDTSGRNYKNIFKKYDKSKFIFATKKLIGVYQGMNDGVLDYSLFSNYKKAVDYVKENKIIYTYEYIQNGEWIHKGCTYYVKSSQISYEEYLNKCNMFFDKLKCFI